MADLVPVAQQKLDRLRIGLDAPSRHEHGLPDAEMLPDLDDARDGDARAVAERRGQADASPRILRIVEVKQALGVEIEGEADGATGAVRPGRRILDELQHTPAFRLVRTSSGMHSLGVNSNFEQNPKQIRGGNPGAWPAADYDRSTNAVALPRFWTLAVVATAPKNSTLVSAAVTPACRAPAPEQPCRWWQRWRQSRWQPLQWRSRIRDTRRRPAARPQRRVRSA